MPAIVAANELIEVKFYCKLGSQVSVNVRHWRCTLTAGDSVNDTVIANTIRDNFDDAYKAVLVAAAEFHGVGVQIIRSPLPEQAQTLTALPNGAVAGDPLPPTVSGIITLKTGNAGRAHRGRIYVPFPGEASSGPDAKPTVGYKATLADLGDLLIAPFTADAGGGNIANFEAVLVRRPNYVTVQPLTAHQVRPYWARQKRRDDRAHADIAPF